MIFSLPKYFHYADPQLSCRVEGNEIVVSAKAHAKSVEIQNENEDLLLSDNYFDMNAGETRVKVLSVLWRTCACAASTITIGPAPCLPAGFFRTP